MTKWIWAVTGILICVSVLVKLEVGSTLAIFVSSALAIIPLATIMGRSTEAIAAHAGPRVGGLLSASFGNAVELIIGAIALRDGLIDLVKASITGSIIGNLLFVLGISFFVGGIKHPIQRFNLRAAQNNASMLLMTVGITFVLPAIFSNAERHPSIILSVAVAFVSLTLYFAGLLFSLFTHREMFAAIDETVGEAGTSQHHWRLWPAVLVLLVTTLAVGMESDWMVASVHDVGRSLGWNDVFIGVIVVAVVGNAAEHASAVWMAWKNRMDLSLEIAVGSSLQVAMFVAPVLFFLSLVAAHPMFLVFSWPELASMGAAAILVTVLMMDGESHWLEGALAVGAYLVMAVGFFTLQA